MGVGIVAGILILSLVYAARSGRQRLGPAVYFVVMGLLLASLSPGLASSTNQWVTSIVRSVQNIDVNK